MKSILTLVLAGALASATTATWAHDGSLASTIDAPRAAEARVGFRIPLGGDRFERAKPTYGAQLNMANSGPVSERTSVPLAAFNFTGTQVTEARLGAVNFAGGQTAADGTRLGLFEDMSPVVIGLLVVVGIWGVYELTKDDDDCEDDGGDEDEDGICDDDEG